MAESVDELTHVDPRGEARMVDVGEKPTTRREAEARGRVLLRPETVQLVRQNAAAKGDVLAVARIAGIMAAKRTAELIPLCHGLPLSAVNVDFELDDAGVIEITARASTSAQTGVEMEALTAVTVAGLTIYDMCKAADRGMRLTDVRLTFKSGGRSGEYRAD
jgi:cyclic pyranopterin phosphate synthase